MQGQHSTIEGDGVDIAGSREGRAGRSKDGSDHGTAACCVNRRRTADLPEDVLGLSAVDQMDALGEVCARAADGEGGGHLEDPDGIIVATGVEGEISALDGKGARRGLIDAGGEGAITELSGTAAKG